MMVGRERGLAEFLSPCRNSTLVLFTLCILLTLIIHEATVVVAVRGGSGGGAGDFVDLPPPHRLPLLSMAPHWKANKAVVLLTPPASLSAARPRSWGVGLRGWDERPGYKRGTRNKN